MMKTNAVTITLSTSLMRLVNLSSSCKKPIFHLCMTSDVHRPWFISWCTDNEVLHGQTRTLNSYVILGKRITRASQPNNEWTRELITNEAIVNPVTFSICNFIVVLFLKLSPFALRCVSYEHRTKEPYNRSPHCSDATLQIASTRLLLALPVTAAPESTAVRIVRSTSVIASGLGTKIR